MSPRRSGSPLHAMVLQLPQPVRIRLFGLLHLYFRMTRGMTLGVRGAVLNERGEVLLVRHTYTPGWHMPGGGVEPGETLEQALAKELREEARLTLTGPVALHGIHLNRKRSPRDHVAVFVVRNFVLASGPPTDSEIAESRFVPLDDLPPDTTGGTRRRLAEIAAGLPPRPDW